MRRQGTNWANVIAGKGRGPSSPAAGAHSLAGLYRRARPRPGAEPRRCPCGCANECVRTESPLSQHTAPVCSTRPHTQHPQVQGSLPPTASSLPASHSLCSSVVGAGQPWAPPGSLGGGGGTGRQDASRGRPVQGLERLGQKEGTTDSEDLLRAQRVGGGRDPALTCPSSPCLQPRAPPTILRVIVVGCLKIALQLPRAG